LIKQLELDKYKNKILTIGARFVDTSLFQVRKKLQDRKNIIGYIGRLSQEKGIINFIDAMSLIIKEDNDIDFIIVGGGELLSKVEGKVRASGVHDKVTIIGEVPSSIVPNYLNELKLLVVPSYNEAGPQTVIEAMACGTPILATPVGWVPDLIEDGKTGFILADNSPECIAKNVTRVLKQQNLEDIVQNAHNLVMQRYTLKAASQRYRAIMQSVVERTKKGGI
jgi:glycosyltransferase involved in cell wall biosynthesis